MKQDSSKPRTTQANPLEHRRRFRALVAATSDVIYSLSPDWEVMQELDGRGFLPDSANPITNWRSKNIPADEHPKVNAVINEAIRDKKVFELEHRVLRADGSTGWTFSRAIPILDENGDILEWLGTASDITDRKLAEEALQESRIFAEKQRRIYETITSNTPDLMYVFDLNYRFTYANNALLTMWGKTWENAIGKSLPENGYEPWHAEMHENEIDKIILTKQPIRGEVSFPHAILGKRIYDYIFTPVFDENGNVEAIAGTTRDVTERKQWEESLARKSKELQGTNEKLAMVNEEQAASNEELIAINEELAYVNKTLEATRQKVEEAQIALRLAIDAADFGTWYIHSETRNFFSDNRLKELFGYYPEESLSIEQAIARIREDYRGFVSRKLENAIYNNGDYDVTYPVIGLHDEQLRWLRAIGNLKADPSGAFSAFTGVVMDITEQYLAAKKVERAEESLRMAIEAAGLATFSIHSGDRSLLASPKLKEFFGFLPTEEMPFELAVNQIHPDYREQVVASIGAAFDNGTSVDMEYPIIGYHDNKLRWVRSMGEVQSSDGTAYFTGLLHEITEKKVDELRKNDFIGMVSHELKTPLTTLTAVIQVAASKLKTSPDKFLAGAMDTAGLQTKKMIKMINGFLNISRLESGKLLIVKEEFDLDGLLQEIISETEITLTHHVIHYDACETILVTADRDKIGSVVSNLLSNAIKYSPKAQIIDISCKIKDNEAIVGIRDYGIGVKREEKEKLFDRYYRVESNSTQHISGFGIGLYLSAEIIRRHDGHIWIESEYGNGSTFYFSLPLDH